MPNTIAMNYVERLESNKDAHLDDKIDKDQFLAVLTYILAEARDKDTAEIDVIAEPTPNITWTRLEFKDGSSFIILTDDESYHTWIDAWPSLASVDKVTTPDKRTIN